MCKLCQPAQESGLQRTFLERGLELVAIIRQNDIVTTAGPLWGGSNSQSEIQKGEED